MTLPVSPNLIHMAVEGWAERTPDALAIEGSQESLTYSALHARAWKLARLLQEAGFSRGARGGILLESSVECITAMLGVLRADGCYMPLGINNPTTRIAQVLTDSAPEALITSTALLPLLASAIEECAFKPRVVVIMESDLPESIPTVIKASGQVICLRDIENANFPHAQKNIGQDLAYLLYTSGSTGRPKGVMVRHANVKAYLDWFIKRLGILPEDRLSNHASPTFDISVQDIFGAMFAGASVHPLETTGEKAFPGPFIRKRSITCWNSVPSVISFMVKARQLSPGAFPMLRAAVFAGEPLLPGMAQAWLDALPDCKMYNFYGPTESTIVVAHYEINAITPGKSIPIGLPTEQTECLILNSDNQPVPAGTSGRLFIRGAQVTAGYWNDPEKTDKAFIINPVNRDLRDVVYDTGDMAMADVSGVITYMGRADNQLKIRGYRVELEDVESAFGSLAGVLETAALLNPNSDGQELLIAVAGPAQNVERAEESLLEAVAKLLPTYMIPQHVLFFKMLPRNINGKVDRNSLRDAVVARLEE